MDPAGVSRVCPYMELEVSHTSIQMNSGNNLDKK